MSSYPPLIFSKMQEVRRPVLRRILTMSTFRINPPLELWLSYTGNEKHLLLKPLPRKNLEQVNQFTAWLEQEYRKEFVEAAKERIEARKRINNGPSMI